MNLLKTLKSFGHIKKIFEQKLNPHICNCGNKKSKEKMGRATGRYPRNG